MAYVFFWFCFAIAVGIFASNKGRSGLAWFLLSAIISPLLGFIFCAVSKDLSKNTTAANVPSTNTHRKCPACAELILPEAVVCKHCGKALEADTGFRGRKIAEQQQAIYDENMNLARGVGFIALLIGIVVMVTKCG